MIIEDMLLTYGPLGIFVVYLIIDRQTVIKGLERAIKDNTVATNRLSETVLFLKKDNA